MKYLVVLDPRSAVGAEYANGNNDGTTTGGNPVIDCSEVAMDAPYFACTREIRSSGGSDQQTLWIPHHAVAYVVGYAKGAPRPLGFVPR